MPDYPTLFEWAGGREAFDRMINSFYDRVEQDKLLAPFFPSGVHAEHRRNVTTWWCEVFGGPTEYTRELGGTERMVHKHLQLGITKDQRFRFASLMSLAADDAEMPRCQMIQSFALLLSPTSNGAPASRSLTHKRTPRSLNKLRCLGGDGERHRPISRNPI